MYLEVKRNKRRYIILLIERLEESEIVLFLLIIDGVFMEKYVGVIVRVEVFG